MVHLLQSDSVISPEAAELIQSRIYDREGLRKLAALLPEDDADLHRWLETAAEALEEDAFRMLFGAAAIGGRTLQASLLPAAMGMREAPWNLAWVAWRMEGDVTGELLHALETVAYGKSEMRALALFVAAAWWRKHRAPEPLPAQIAHLANALWKEKLDLRAAVALQSLAILLAETDAGCNRELVKALSPAAQRKQLAKMFALLDGPYDRFVYEKVPHDYVGTRPQRRAVQEVGRNQTCPCGSGKKYKRCCERTDQERGRRASPVAGVTRDEILSDTGGILTEAHLEVMGPAVASVDPARVPTGLQEQFILNLAVLGQYEAIIAAFQAFGVPEHLRAVWSHIFTYIVGSWRPDIGRQLMEVFPDAEEKLGEKAHPGIRILLVGDDPARFLETLESELRGLLADGDLDEFERLMWSLVASPYRALGIILARSLLPLAAEKSVPGLFEGILEARAKLNLPPEDEFSAWMDEHALRKSRKHETAAAQEMQDKLTAKMAELRRTQEKLARVDRELALRAHKEREQVASPRSTTVDEEAERKIAGLMADRKRLQSQVSQNSGERLELRRKLQAAEKENEALKAEAVTHQLKETDDDDFQVEGTQPVRLPQFPVEFLETLASYPRHVGRAAMNRLGRLASGEPAAFERVKQLKAYPEVLRARVSDKFRLLFSLTPQHVRVVDLIRRADLDRRIERLKVSGLPSVG